MAPPRFRDDIPLIRLLVVLVLFGAGTALLSVGPRAGDVSGRDWYGGGHQRFLLADLSFRVGQTLEWVAGTWTLPLAGQGREFEERAVAEYERQGLGAPPSAAALQRLGLIYGSRGYAEQAQEMLSRAAALDEGRADLLFTLAALYDPQTPLVRVRNMAPSTLRGQESWLGDLAVAARAARLDDPAEAQSAALIADHHTGAFAWALLVIGLGYGLVALVGAAIIVRAALLFLFTTRRGRRPAPLFVASWEPLDALEGAGLLCFTMAAMAVGLGFLSGSLSGGSAAPLGRLALVVGQYLLATAIVLALIWLRVPGATREKCRALGWRAPRGGHLVLQGLGAYGVLLCCLAVAAAFFPGQSGPAVLLNAGSARPVLGEALRTPLTALLVFGFVSVLVPLLEETIFRGFIYAGLRRHWPVSTAALASALLFAVMHHSGAALLPIGLIGLALALVYERTHSLVPSFICHAAHNLLILALLFITQ